VKIEDVQKQNSKKQEVISEKVKEQNEELPPGNPVDNVDNNERPSSESHIIKDPITN
jgi:hypothetical protein